jgi:hypothetical protein
MTTREHLNQLRRRSQWVAIPAFLLIIITMIVARDSRGATWAEGASLYFIMSCWGVFFVAGIYSLASGRCQLCHEHLNSGFITVRKMVDRIPPKLRFCPYCGESLDKEADCDAAKR